MKLSKKISKYNKPKLENPRPICPICGSHTIETEYEDRKYKIDGETFTLKEAFFRCYKDGEIYETEAMRQETTNKLRAYMLKREIQTRNGIDDKLKIPSAVKEKIDNNIPSNGGDTK